VSSSLFPSELESDGARYELGRLLGTGNTGAVYLAIDRETGEQVALKKLQRIDNKSVLRLKREFRSLTNMHHRNLVKLYDLGRSSDAWFLTMEYVEGIDLLKHLGVQEDPLATGHGSARGPVVERVLDAFHQLACGVHALHQAKLLHRDLKPSNVLVAGERVVTLDFGLARDVDDSDLLVTQDGTVSGTPAYMPPEQALGHKLSEVSDWYAVGVMLYQVMSGRLPIDGRNANELLRRKLESDPVPLDRLDVRLPKRLSQLCMRLLARDPAARPRGQEVLSVLGQFEPPSLQLDMRSVVTDFSLRTESQSRPGERRLFGRERELSQLREALEVAHGGEPVVVHVRGASGAGKTALVENFLEQLAVEPLGLGFSQPLFLRSRCYEREAMPFKALDGLIDALVRHLSQLDDIDVAHLLPADVAELAQLFPALDRLRAVQRLLTVAKPHLPAPQARTRAEQALRELLLRLSARRTLILWIDDLQWGDLDSASVLESWLPHLRSAPILLIFSYRSEELHTSSCLRVLLDGPGTRSSLSAAQEVLELSPLPDEEMRQLCEQRLSVGGAGRAQPALIARIVQESRGNPFLASQLIALAQSQLEGPEPELRALSMEELVTRSTALVSAEARAILNVLAVAGRPLATQTALRAAGVQRDGSAHLHALKSVRLIRTREVAGERRLEVYHDRVREGVHAALDAQARERVYDRLLRELEVSGNLDADWLHTLALGAGQRVPALRYGLIAAERASSTLAFERAAELYQKCLELTEPAAVSGELYYKLALALARCRRGTQAAEAYLQAAARAEGEQALGLERMAALHLLRSGQFVRGEKLVDKVLRAQDAAVPESEGGLVAALAWERSLLLLRGGRHSPKVEAEVPNELRERVDLFATLTVDSMVYDSLRAALFQARCMRLALSAGDAASLTRAYCLAATVACVSGSERAARRSDQLLSQAETLCRPLGRVRLLRYLHVSRAVCAYLLGQPQRALPPAAEAERLYSEDTRGDEQGEYYHVFTANTVRIGALASLGQYARFTSELEACVERARSTDNHSMLLHLSLHQTLAEQLRGQPRLSRARLDQQRAWLPQRFGMLHVLHMCSVMSAASATSDFEWAHHVVDAWWARYRSSFVHKSAYLALLSHSEHARMLLNEAVTRAKRRDVEPLVQDDLRALDDCPLTQLAQPAALLLRARLAGLRGQTEQALQHLRAAVAGFEAAGIGPDASLARWALGRTLADDEGRQLCALAEQQLREHGVHDLRAMLVRRFPELTAPV